MSIKLENCEHVKEKTVGVSASTCEYHAEKNCNDISCTLQ